MIAKLRPSPAITSEPMVTFAPTAWNWTMISLPVAPVSRRKSRAVRVTKVPRRISRVSTVSWNASTLPPVKVSAIRNASSSSVPSGRLVVRGDPVGERGAERLAREQLRPAGGDVDDAGEAGVLGDSGRPRSGSVTCRPGDTDADVVEFEDAAEGDLLVRLRGVRALAGSTAPGGGRQPVGQFGGAELEAVAVDGEARDDADARAVGSLFLAMLEDVAGSYGRSEPVIPKDGKVIVAVLIRTISWSTAPFGS